jgi:hypothetical protein
MLRQDLLAVRQAQRQHAREKGGKHLLHIADTAAWSANSLGKEPEEVQSHLAGAGVLRCLKVRFRL